MRHISSIHENRKNHTCPICQKMFFCNIYLKKHISTVHEKQKNHKCPVCNAAFGFKSYVAKHISAVHENQKNYTCPHCPKLYASNVFLQQHITTIHGKQKSYNCPICLQSFGYLSNFQRHTKFQHLERNVQSNATAEGSSGRSLEKVIPSRHEEEVKRQNLFSCHECDWTCSSRAALKTHLQKEHDFQQ